MDQICLAVPILSGKVDIARDFMTELEQERKRLTGEAAVMRELLRRCNTVLLTIEPESAAEHEAIGELSDAIERALGEAKGTLL